MVRPSMPDTTTSSLVSPSFRCTRSPGTNSWAAALVSAVAVDPLAATGVMLRSERFPGHSSRTMPVRVRWVGLVLDGKSDPVLTVEALPPELVRRLEPVVREVG